jgi:hypothetical protein
MYRRVTREDALGARRQDPACPSSIAPKIDGLSNRGQQSQSIDPLRPTSATVRPSPMAA